MPGKAISGMPRPQTVLGETLSCSKIPLPGIPGHVFEVFGFDLAPCSIASQGLSLETHFVINYDGREGGWKFVLWRHIIYQTPKVAESIKAYFECLDKRGFCVECLNRREALKTFTEATVSQICQDPIQANTKSVSIVLKIKPFEFLAAKPKS